MQLHRIGLFKTGENFTLYLDKIYWNDLCSLFQNERDIKVNHLVLLAKDSGYLFYDDRYSIKRGTPQMECFKKLVTYKFLNKKIQSLGKPYEFEIRLQNGIKISSELWDDCTISLPKNLVEVFLPNCLVLKGYKNIPTIIENLKNSLECIMYIDDYGLIEKQKTESISNLKDYITDILYCEKSELLDIDHAKGFAGKFVIEFDGKNKMPFKTIGLTDNCGYKIILSGWNYRNNEFEMLIDFHYDFVVFYQKDNLKHDDWINNSTLVEVFYSRNFRIMETEIENYRLAHGCVDEILQLSKNINGKNPFIKFKINFIWINFDEICAFFKGIFNRLDEISNIRNDVFGEIN